MGAIEFKKKINQVRAFIPYQSRLFDIEGQNYYVKNQSISYSLYLVNGEWVTEDKVPKVENKSGVGERMVLNYSAFKSKRVNISIYELLDDFSKYEDDLKQLIENPKQRQLIHEDDFFEPYYEWYGK